MKKSNDSGIVLLFPPHFSIFQPYPATPCLTSYLRREGIKCIQDDLNIRAFHYFVSKDFFNFALQKVQITLKNNPHKKCLENYKAKQLDYMSKIREHLPALRKKIVSAISYFKNCSGDFTYSEYLRNYKTISSVFGLVSVVFYPSFLSLGEFRTIYSPESSNDILKASFSEDMNPYIRFFDQYVSQRLTNLEPTLIGMSIIGLTQMIPALTLCRMLKERLPGSRIVIGGVIPSQLCKKIKAVPGLFDDFFDYVIIGEGEVPLFMLYESLTKGTRLEQIPNLMFKSNGIVKQNAWNYFAEVDNLPAPDYSDMPIDLYLSPIPVPSIETGRGCYWRHCRFCNQFAVHGNTYRPKTPGKVVSEIRELAERHSTNLFAFVNEALPLNQLRKVSEDIVKSDLEVRWYASARLDEQAKRSDMFKALKDAGCYKLFFGMESGSQKVLDAMRKGIKSGDMPEIFEKCKSAGIDVFVYLMIGYPTETDKDREQTLSIILNNVDSIDGFYISDFTAMICSPIMKEVTELGYELVFRPELDLQYLYEHRAVPPIKEEPSGEEIYRIEKQMWRKIKNSMVSKAYPDIAPMYICFKYLEETKRSRHNEK